MTVMAAAKTRPYHCGRWTTIYDGREKMTAAGLAALDDARSAEQGGYPTPETAEDWLAAMQYHYDTFGGGLAEFEAAPPLAEAVRQVRNALIAAAYMARQQVIDRDFANYQPINTVGMLWCHRLLELAYDCPSIYRPDWSIEQAARSAWYRDVMAALESVREQWSGDWPREARRIAECAGRRLA